MTYAEIVSRLATAGIVDAEYEAALLIEHFCGIDRSALLLRRREDLAFPELEDAVARRAERFPIQYIIGEWYFCNQVYELSPDCLIPRPDTELLVERAAATVAKDGRFIDLGTGSGCISISLLASRSDLRGLAADISEGAIAQAKKNALRNGVSERLEFSQINMLDNKLWESGQVFDAIISNPPYIPTRQLADLDPELAHEPSRALDGGEDGLVFYRKIVENAHRILAPRGVILFEFALDQSDDIEAIAVANGYKYTLYRDIEERPRACLLERI